MNLSDKGAIVFGGHIQGLSIIRMLGKKNVPVILVDDVHLNIARFSKYCNKFIKINKNSYSSDDDFVNMMDFLYQEYDIDRWIIFATDDIVTGLISKNRDVLKSKFTVWNQHWNVVKHCFNKRLTYDMAEKLSIPYPRSFYPNNIDDLLENRDLFDFPLIIKPAIMHLFYTQTKQKVFVVDSFEELIDKYKLTCKIIDPNEVIIQEIIPGTPENLYSYGSFHNIDHTEGYVIGRRSRQIPMDFGKGSTFVELCNIDEIRELSLRFLKAIGYYGLSEVEFKYDERDDKFKLLEINPRAWRWHSIVHAAGLNLPFRLFMDLYINCKKNHDFVYNYKDIKWMEFYSDVYIVFNEILKGNMTLKYYLNSLKGKISDGVFNKNDIMPFIAETFLLPYLLLTR